MRIFIPVAKLGCPVRNRSFDWGISLDRRGKFRKGPRSLCRCLRGPCTSERRGCPRRMIIDVNCYWWDGSRSVYKPRTSINWGMRLARTGAIDSPIMRPKPGTVSLLKGRSVMPPSPPAIPPAQVNNRNRCFIDMIYMIITAQTRR